MAERLVIAGASLSAAHAQLVRLRGEFESATARADDASESVGHPGLAQELRNVASGWNLHRKKLLDTLQALEGHLKGTIDTFEKVDTDIANNLRPESGPSGSVAPARPGPGSPTSGHRDPRTHGTAPEGEEVSVPPSAPSSAPPSPAHAHPHPQMPDHAGSPDHPHADHSSHHPDGFPEDGGKEFRPDDHLRSGIRGIPESPGSTSLPPYTLFPIDSIPPEVRDVAGRLRELVSSPEFAAKYPAFTAGALAGALISLAGASGRSAGPTASAGSGAPISPQIRATEAIRAAVADSSPAAMDTGAARMSPAEARAALDAKFGDSGARPIPSATAAALTAEHSGVRGGGSAADPKAGSAMWQENPNAVGVVPGGDGSAAGARPAGGAASDFSAPSGVHRSGGAPAPSLIHISEPTRPY